MKRFVQVAGLAACAAAFSLVDCSSAGAPHPQPGAAGSSVRARANLIAGAGSVLRDLSVPKHVLTWDWYLHVGEVDPQVAAPYLDYAAVQHADANAFDAAGIKTILYTDPNRTYVGQPMYTNDESTFAHDCNGNRITIPSKPIKTYQMDPRSPHLEPLWAAWVNGVLGAGYNYTYIFEDSANSVHGNSAVPCGYDETSWTAASNANDVALGQNIIYNGLGTLGDGWNKPPPSILINPTTFGGHLEGCYANVSLQNPMPKTTVWYNFETTELTMSNLPKTFVCRGLKASPAENSYPERIYQYASFLLTYNLDTSIISEKFSTPSNLHVYPEETLVALEPLIQSPASVAALKKSSWVFGRQYAACYLGGQLIGSCAAVVNAGNAANSRPFPWPGIYSHTLLLSGAGIIDGGTASAAGPPPPAMVPGTSAVIAIQ
jgi:hypothetical protein